VPQFLARSVVTAPVGLMATLEQVAEAVAHFFRELPEPDAQALEQAPRALRRLSHEKTEQNVDRERDEAVKNAQYDGSQPDEPDFLVETRGERLADPQYDGLPGFAIQVSFHAVKKSFVLHHSLLWLG